MDSTNTRITAGLERKMDEAIRRYPADRKRSAAMPLLHLWQEEFGFISDEGVRWIAARLDLQPINILELVTFYPMFRQAPAGRKHLRVCRTLSCAMAGSYEVMEKACAAAGITRHHDDNGMHTPISVGNDGEFSIEFVECLASCGTAPVCMVQDDLIENVKPEAVSALVTNHQSLITDQQPPPHPLEHRLVFKNIGRADWTPDIDCYLRNGGYQQLKAAIKMSRVEIVNEVKTSNLRGRGGAGFPCGVKWSFIKPDEKKPVYLICNADESEPGTFKDRYIIHEDPHQLIEGMLISCFALNARTAYIYIRGEFPEGARILERAIEEAREHNFLGQNMLGTGFDVEIFIHRGAGAYICGEETGLIESLEGKRAYPRIKPPYFPAVLGLYMCPTIVNNVETLCHVKHIIEMGGAKYAQLGRPNNTGTRIVCVSGDVQRPGYFEIEVGAVTMGQLIYDMAGGPRYGRNVKAVIPGGSSAKVLRADERFKLKLKQPDGSMAEQDASLFEIPMDFDTLAAAGSMAGSGGVIVLDDSRDMVWTLNNINEFYAHESCGQCTPCREGSLWMKKITDRMLLGGGVVQDPDTLKTVADNIAGRTICAFGEACAWPTQSFVEKFRDEFNQRGQKPAPPAMPPEYTPGELIDQEKFKRLPCREIRVGKRPPPQARFEDDTPSPSYEILMADPATSPQLVNVQVNGVWHQFPKGTRLIEACEQAGSYVPRYCYHKKLSSPGNCRMCLIEMGLPKMRPDRTPELGADGKPIINWMPRPQISCAQDVTEGMGVRTDSPLAQECRKGVMEFLLINHPLDCPICDQAGECRLQEFSVEYGTSESRFLENKVKKPKNIELGPRVTLDDERCILCSRCIRFCQEIAHDDVLGFVDRGSHSVLTAHPGKRLENNYSLNTVDICPVGALTSSDFRFQMRVWFLKETKSFCTSCATGCNTIIGTREDVIYRQTPRENNAVNSSWMCDYGRLNFGYLQSEQRLLQPEIRSGDKLVAADWSAAITHAAVQLKQFSGPEIAILASGRMTNEELWLTAQLAKALGVQLLDIVPRLGPSDDILLSADRNPNTNGARLLGVTSFPGARLQEIADGVAAGRIKGLIALGENPIEIGLTVAQLKALPAFIAMNILADDATRVATAVLPSFGFAEKRGSMINGKGRLQRLNRAVRGPGQARDDWEILRDLIQAVSGQNSIYSIEDVFRQMSESVPQLAGLSLSKISDLGVQVLEMETIP